MPTKKTHRGLLNIMHGTDFSLYIQFAYNGSPEEVDKYAKDISRIFYEDQHVTATPLKVQFWNDKHWAKEVAAKQAFELEDLSAGAGVFKISGPTFNVVDLFRRLYGGDINEDNVLTFVLGSGGHRRYLFLRLSLHGYA